MIGPSDGPPGLLVAAFISEEKAGEVTSGVVYDYLRLELNEDYKPGGAQ